MTILELSILLLVAGICGATRSGRSPATTRRLPGVHCPGFNRRACLGFWISRQLKLARASRPSKSATRRSPWCGRSQARPLLWSVISLLGLVCLPGGIIDTPCWYGRWSPAACPTNRS